MEWSYSIRDIKIVILVSDEANVTEYQSHTPVVL